MQHETGDGRRSPAEKATTMLDPEQVELAPRPDQDMAAPAAPRERGRLLTDVALAGGVEHFAGFLALVGFVASAVTRLPVLALGGALLGLVLVLLTPSARRSMPFGAGPGVLLARALLVVPIVGAGRGPLAVAAAVLLGAAALSGPLLARVLDAARPSVAHLPGVRDSVPARVGADLLAVGETGVAALLAALALVPVVPDAALLPPAAAVAVVAAGALLAAGARIRRRRRADAAVAGALTAYEPRFLLHWDAPAGTAYQVRMWLPYLHRVGSPFAVVVRNASSFAEAAAATDAPVVLREDPEDIDAVVVPSVRVAFYVNNAARNTHLVRFSHVLHVQLNHGESDKAASSSPVFRLYDRDFVAGRAAVDRFAEHGVRVPDDFFTVVGRPQVETIDVGPRRSQAPTVLYAPTWGGANADSDYCSLPIGHRIVEALLERGFDVLFRPHPYTDRFPAHAREADRIVALLAADRRRTGRRHRFGDETSTRMSLVDCFNAADVLVSDVSSVLPDFLRSERPMIVTSMREPAAAFAATHPIASAALVLEADAGNLSTVLDRLAADGSRELEARRRVKRYHLGDAPDDDAAGPFLRAVRALLGDG